MRASNLLYKSQVDINDKIHIMIPTVGEILDNEALYYNLVGTLTAMPADIEMMVLLDDNGIDFSEIDDYDLFLLLFRELASSDTSLVFGDLDLTKFRPAVNEQNGMLVMADPETGVVIDRAIHDEIADALRQIHHLTKNRKKPANKEARDFMLERARKKMKRRRRNQKSQLEELIVALVNTEQFSYKYNEVRDMTIYQFNESLRQIIHKIDYDNRMHGVYAGTVSVKDLSQDDLNWLIHK
jgi:hypothetical protein